MSMPPCKPWQKQARMERGNRMSVLPTASSTRGPHLLIPSARRCQGGCRKLSCLQTASTREPLRLHRVRELLRLLRRGHRLQCQFLRLLRQHRSNCESYVYKNIRTHAKERGQRMHSNTTRAQVAPFSRQERSLSPTSRGVGSEPVLRTHPARIFRINPGVPKDVSSRNFQHIQVSPCTHI